ncbi:MAG: M28 family peptidase [Chloroflexi bacterium]|nr:M28 family peptidase [Chloroflexota bacterium]
MPASKPLPSPDGQAIDPPAGRSRRSSDDRAPAKPTDGALEAGFVPFGAGDHTRATAIVDDAVIDRLIAECLSRPRAWAALGELCDGLGGRVSGTASGAAGEEWGLGRFREWGFDSADFEPLRVPVWERGALRAEVIAPAAWSLTAVAHGFAPIAVDLQAELVDLGFAEAEDFVRVGAGVQGRLVLCDEGVRPGRRALHRSEKLGLAAAHGAAGLLILSSAAGGLARTGVCHADLAPIPSLGISREDGLRLRRLAAAPNAIPPTLRIHMRNRYGSGQARNVLAELPGRDPDAGLVLAGAHLDSWDLAQGATDNGLGAAIVLEMARALAALPASLRPRRRMRFALWAAEETGLRGSKAYVAAHAGELGHHAAVMNFDMTGDPYGYWAPGRADATTLLVWLAHRLAPLGMRQDLRHEAGLHSDHQPFMLAGVPVVALLGELGEQGGRYYHSVGDTFEKVSLPALCRAAAVGAITLWALADADDALALPHFGAAEVRGMIDAADLTEALRAEGYAGPPMQIDPTGVSR